MLYKIDRMNGEQLRFFQTSYMQSRTVLMAGRGKSYALKAALIVIATATSAFAFQIYPGDASAAICAPVYWGG